MSDTPNSDQIRQIAENQYFQSIVKEQVRDRVNAQWDQTRKVLAPPWRFSSWRPVSLATRRSTD